VARPRTNAPRIPTDARAQRSLEALRKSFLDLIEQKSLDQITIKEICDGAGLSYPTFFRRFASKEELIKDIATEEISALLYMGQNAMDPGLSPNGGESFCLHIEKNRRLWTALITGGAAPFVREEFLRIARDVANSRPRKNPWLPLALATAFVTSGIFEILAWWMNQPEEYPIGNVIKLFDALITDSAGRRRDISLE
jgi:AcrR family transcriptional regulator